MNVLKLIAPVGLAGGATAGLPGQMPDGHEGAFGDTLSMVLAGTVIAPIAQQSQLGVRDLATLSLTSAHDMPTELETGEIAASPQIGGQQLTHPLIGTATNAGIEPATTAPLLGFEANSQKPSLPTLQDLAIGQTSTSPKGLFSADQPIDRQPIVRSLADDPATTVPPVPVNGVHPSTAATIGAKVDLAVLSERASEPSKHLLSALPDKPLHAGALNSSMRLPDQGQPSIQQVSQEASKAGLHQLNHALAPDQRPLQSNQQSTSAQRVPSSETKAYSLTSNLLQKGQPADTALITKDLAPAPPTPVQNVGVVEAWNSDIASNTEALEFFSSESGRLDLNNALTPKPQTQTPQAPHMQIAVQMTRALPQGVDRFTIQLHPMELGTVDVQLNFAEDGHVSALIVAERPETLDMLQRDSRALERSLANAGLQLEDGSLSFSLKQDQDQKGQGFSHSDFGQSQPDTGDTSQGSGGSERPIEQDVQLSRHRLLDIRT